MAIFLWVCGGFLALLVLGLLFLFLVVAPNERRKTAELTARIEEYGQLVYCYIVMANPDLYKERDTEDYSFAQVVYTHDDPPDTDLLKRLGKKLKIYKAVAGASKEDRIVSNVMKSHVPYHKPLQVPSEVAGEDIAYTVSLNVYWNKLPKKRLSREFLWCKVIEGEDGGIRMADAPKNTN